MFGLPTNQKKKKKGQKEEKFIIGIRDWAESNYTHSAVTRRESILVGVGRRTGVILSFRTTPPILRLPCPRLCQHESRSHDVASRRLARSPAPSSLRGTVSATRST